MSEEIRVTVVSLGPDRNLALQYVDPISGRRKTKSAKTRTLRAAEREAEKWESQLRSGQFIAPSKITWKEFRKRYETEKLVTLSPNTAEITKGSFNHLEAHLSPDRLCKLTSAVLSKFQAILRETGMQETTITKVLRHLKAALRWGERVGLMDRAPRIEMPKRLKGKTMAKARAVTGEEFDRMIAAVPKVRPQDAPAWRRYLTGLWLSGLRLRESLILSWDTNDPFAVDLTGKRPVFVIRGEAQKSGKDEVLPMTPDFAELLLKTPETERQGRVFTLCSLRTGERLIPREVGRIVTKIGEKARVVVNRETEKFASCHDLRRSFCTRWAPRVKPAVLQKLARHSEITTTLKYYTMLDAADVAEELWTSFGPKADNKVSV